MRRLARGLFLLAALLVAAPAYPQHQPPVRVGRVGIVEGALAFYGPGDSDWSAARVNFPVAENGWFATDPDARAGLRIGAASISLDKNTQAGFTALNDKATQIALAQGRIDLHLRRLTKGETAEVDIGRGAVWLLQPGIYEIDAGGADQPSRIQVFEGSARFVGGGADMAIKAGDALVLSGSDTVTASVEPVTTDEFTRWCRSHDYQEDRLAAPYHVSPAMTGYEELDAYGQWAEVPDYGQVWYPASVGDDWAPYREGHWAWVEPWGWNWIDDEPWGFAPFHYGRWARIDDRWGWVPGSFVEEPVYAPALVAFVAPPADYGVADAGPAVGWFPLAPGEVYWPSYTRDRTYIRNVNTTNVNVTVINRVTQAAAMQRSASPPPQLARQNFANRAAVTVVPVTAFARAAKVAPAAIALSPQALQRATVTVRPPATIAQPSAIAATGPASRRAAPPAVPFAAQQPTARPGARPAGRPNFSHLAPAPQLARPGVRPAQAIIAPPAPAANPSGEQRPAEAKIPPAAPGHGLPLQQPGQATTATPTPGRPPAPPDFSHLAPSRVHPGQPGHAAAPVTTAPETHPGAPPPPGVAGREPGHRPGPEPSGNQPPPPSSHVATPSGQPQGAAQQHRAQQEAIAKQQAQERAAAEAARAQAQQAQQRGAAGVAARQQAQQRSAAEAAARQQAQQRAAAQAAAQQQAQQRAAAQAQQRAAAQAAAQQQAQQRAAAQAQQRAAVQQQAQQRAAAQAVAQQKAAQQHGSSQPHCGHPNEPACPK